MVFEHLFVGDFENTTGGTSTYVYGGGFMETTDADATIFENIDDSMHYILSLPKRSLLYFQNGSNYDDHLIVYWLLQHGYVETQDKNVRKRFYGICADGKWYVLKIHVRNYVIEIRDTCLLINGSLSAVGRALGCPTSKLVGTIDYDKPRGVGYVMDDVEREYLRHDVLLLKEIVIAMQSMGGLANYITAGAFAFAELKASLYKTMHHKSDYEMELLKQHPKFKQFANHCFRTNFPEIPVWQDDEIRHAYRGGWCYNNTALHNGDIIYNHGLVLDVNSLYPSVLRNHEYPYGSPRRYIANRVPASGNSWLDNEIAQCGVTVDNTRIVKCYIVEISTRFRLKKDHVPCIQLKGNSYFVPTEYATTSQHMVDGKLVDDDVVISLCSADLELFFEQYDVLYFEVLSGYEFSSYDHFFDDFIDTHYEAKKKAAQTGNRILKNTSKIILNSSYGGFAQRIHKRRNVAYIDEDGALAYNEVKDEKYPDRTYTAVGVFCTAYARQVTLRVAQMFYNNFCYSDTDSVHLVGLTYDDVKDKINIDPVELGYWALESEWDMARFVRPKTYMERTVVEDGVALDEPKIDIKACGLTDEGKDMLREDDDIWFKFTFGLALEDCKLMKHHCVGGVNLIRRDWCIRG